MRFYNSEFSISGIMFSPEFLKYRGNPKNMTTNSIPFAYSPIHTHFAWWQRAKKKSDTQTIVSKPCNYWMTNSTT